MMNNNDFTLNSKEEDTLQKVVRKINLKAILDKFYDHFTDHQNTHALFADVNIEELKAKQKDHWINLLHPKTREETLLKSAQIGQIHEKHGISPEIYLSGYSFILTEIIHQAISNLGFTSSTHEKKNAISAINKIFMADITASLSSYNSQADHSLIESAQRNTLDKIIDNAIDTSMAMSHLFIDNLKTQKIVDDVQSNISAISASIEQMSATVSTINGNTNDAMSYIQTTESSAKEGLNVSSQAAQTMNSIKDEVADTTDKARLLSESSEQIKGIITQIQDIAEQTNLLALNATIEAARAGEAGKGFAVVANEVKSLANQTSNATQEITNIISNIISSIQHIEKSMGDMSNSVQAGQEVTEDVKDRMASISDNANIMGLRMNDISSALSEQSSASVEISNSSSTILTSSQQNLDMSRNNASLSRSTSIKIDELIANIAEFSTGCPRTILKLAKSDHIVWKRKLTDLLLGDSELSESELKSHKECRLGGWYYSAGIEHFSGNPIFEELEAPHILVHKLGHEIYEHKQKNEIDKAFEKLDRLEEASEVVIDMLNKLDTQLTAKTG